MIRYSKVTRRLWGDEVFRSLSAPPPSARELWLYLLTCPEQTAVPGIFRAFEGGIADALQWPLEALREAFLEVFAKGLARADWRSGVVVLPKAFFHNPPESPNHVLGWKSAWQELPECELKASYFHILKPLVEGLDKGSGKAYREAFAKALCQPSRYQEQEQEQEQDLKRESAPVRARPRNAAADGVFGMSVTAFADAVRLVTGVPYLLPRPGSAEIMKLVDAIIAFCPEVNDRVEWAKVEGGAYAVAQAGKRLSVHGFVDWLNSGSPNRSSGTIPVGTDPAGAGLVEGMVDHHQGKRFQVVGGKRVESPIGETG